MIRTTIMEASISQYVPVRLKGAARILEELIQERPHITKIIKIRQSLRWIGFLEEVPEETIQDVVVRRIRVGWRGLPKELNDIAPTIAPD